MKKIITVSREFGSGGRELGKRLADYLGLSYFDSEIAEEMSKQTNLDMDYLSGKLERGVAHYPATFASSFSRISSASNSAMLIAKQHKIIKDIAKINDCVIVGRGADAVLSEYAPFKIFVYADMPAKIERCKNRAPEGEKLTDKELEKKIKSIDKGRKSMYDIFSSHAWGEKSAYNLCINTTGLDIENIIPAVAGIVNAYFNGE
ncbi:MAG: cytidylate kinase-like family protein [Clostridia bacterium]|nr:cytidylate kinase-like family protein [Clostridia bacterium]